MTEAVHKLGALRRIHISDEHQKSTSFTTLNFQPRAERDNGEAVPVWDSGRHDHGWTLINEL